MLHILIVPKKKKSEWKNNHEPSKPGWHIFQYEPDDHIHVLHKQDKCSVYINISTYPDKSSIKTGSVLQQWWSEHKYSNSETCWFSLHVHAWTIVWSWS